MRIMNAIYGQVVYDEEAKMSIKELYIRGWRVESPLLTVLSYSLSPAITTIK